MSSAFVYISLATFYHAFQVIANKFSEFQLSIDAGQERFNQCEKLATKLIDKKSPYSRQILERQEHIRSVFLRVCFVYVGRNALQFVQH